ncbi:MAG TPA: alpha/beta fold hydrolase [Planctomycetota bacterium]|jgi:pimeloyl-ACP methyl ester carboxylesterase
MKSSLLIKPLNYQCFLLFALLLLTGCFCAAAAETAEWSEVLVISAKDHTFSKRTVLANEIVNLSATGSWKPSEFSGPCGANGQTELYGGASYGALMVKVEDSDKVYPAGAKATFRTDCPGRLEFFMNGESTDRSGELTVTIDNSTPEAIAESKNDAGGREKRIALILVHGNYSEDRKQEGWGAFYELARANPSISTRFHIYSFRHDSSKPIGFNGSTGNAKELADYIERKVTESDIVFLAHSRGGLVCRAYMSYRNQGDSVLGLVTLGTPHHGTPLAVPDWCAELWSKRPIQTAQSFDDLVFRGSHGFDPSRRGDVNLAWDNMDGAIASERKPFRFDVKIANGGYMQLTPGDLNAAVNGIRDVTRFYKDNDKREFGTLEELNRNTTEQCKRKIVAFGGLKETLTSSFVAGSALEARDGLARGIASMDFSSQPVVTKPSKKKTLAEDIQLDVCATLLACTDQECTDSGTNYIANDGLVPIQSALFLDVANRDRFAERDRSRVCINNMRVDARRQVKRQYSYPGFDHADLLLSRDKSYWNCVVKEVLEFADCGKSRADNSITASAPVSEKQDMPITSIAGIAGAYLLDGNCLVIDEAGTFGYVLKSGATFAGKVQRAGDEITFTEGNQERHFVFRVVAKGMKLTRCANDVGDAQHGIGEMAPNGQEPAVWAKQ